MNAAGDDPPQAPLRGAGRGANPIPWVEIHGYRQCSLREPRGSEALCVKIWGCARMSSLTGEAKAPQPDALQNLAETSMLRMPGGPRRVRELLEWVRGCAALNFKFEISVLRGIRPAVSRCLGRRGLWKGGKRDGFQIADWGYVPNRNHHNLL